MTRTATAGVAGLAGLAGLAAIALLTGCHAVPVASVPLEQTETDIDEADLPPDARDALRRLAGPNDIDGFERERRGEMTAFEAEWEDGDAEAEATVLADGAVLETERELADDEFDTLPPAVRARVERLREAGYDVEVARRTVFLYDVDYERPDDDADGDPADGADGDALGAPEDGGELLLRPDGTDATRPPR